MGKNDEVKDFFQTFPEMIDKLTSQHEWTPVMYACRYGNFELLKTFRKIGFKIDEKNVPSLLHLTCYSESIDIIKYLMNEINVNLSRKEVTSLLKISSILGKIEICLFFLVNGGLLIDDNSSRSEIRYFNLHPRTIPLENSERNLVKYFSIPDKGRDGKRRQAEEVTGQELKTSDLKPSYRQSVSKVIPYAKKYKLELVMKMVKKRGVAKKKFGKILTFFNSREGEEYYNQVLGIM